MKNKWYKYRVAVLLLYFLTSLESLAQSYIKGFHITGFAQSSVYHIIYDAKDNIE